MVLTEAIGDAALVLWERLVMPVYALAIKHFKRGGYTQNH